MDAGCDGHARSRSPVYRRRFCLRGRRASDREERGGRQGPSHLSRAGGRNRRTRVLQVDAAPSQRQSGRRPCHSSEWRGAADESSIRSERSGIRTEGSRRFWVWMSKHGGRAAAVGLRDCGRQSGWGRGIDRNSSHARHAARTVESEPTEEAATISSINRCWSAGRQSVLAGSVYEAR